MKVYFSIVNRGIYTVLLFLILIFTSCENESVITNDSSTSGEIKYAKGFEVLETDYGYTLRLFDKDGTAGHEYNFSRETKDGSIQIPIKALSCQSTTHTAFFSYLNDYEVVKGVAYADMIANEEFQRRLDSGDIINLTTGEEIDYELLIGTGSEVILVYPYGDSDFSKFEESGIQIIPISEYLEDTPLGRAEWIKVAGILINRYDEACMIFDKIESRYNSIKAELEETLADSVKPEVFTGSYWKGNWKAPSGSSLISVYLRDAGANYVFDEQKGSGNIELDFEEFISKAFYADYFGKVIYAEGQVSASDFLEGDERLKEIKSYKEKNLFYCNASNTDYFGNGIMEPDVILNDLRRIFWQRDQVEKNSYFHFVHE